MFGFRKKEKKIHVKNRYLSSSEFVSSGHPDRLADNLAAIIIQDIQRKDGPQSHAAIEVFITHDSVVFGGEATTSIKFNKKYLEQVVRLGFKRSGYIGEMRKYWTKEEALLPSNVEIVNKICAQSPDIALGTTDKGEESGWNDQGVFFSSAESTNSNHLGTAQHLAQLICEGLQVKSKESILSPIEWQCSGETQRVVLGPDNKAVVTVKVAEDGYTPIEVTAVTIAVSHSSISPIWCVRDYVESVVTEWILNEGIPIAYDCQWVINGTGRFVVHGPISDTSMTGRKISVNHPSAGPLWSNKMIGGGSLVKPAHASDLILNVMSRYISNVVVAAGLTDYAVVGCAGAIGVQGLQSLFIKGDDAFENSKDKEKVLRYFKHHIEWAPIAIAKKFGFFDEGFNFGLVVDRNFFGHPECQPWENKEIISEEVDKLISYLA